jgi:type II secretory pathway component PulJ
LSPTSADPGHRNAFTLLEVMIACGIFFMATFAILALVAGTLRNARVLQQHQDVDAGMAAAQIFQIVKTNRNADVSGSGDFGPSYRDYSFEFEAHEAISNGLLRVEIVVNKRGLRKPYDSLTMWVHAPDAKSGPGQLNLH